MKYLKIDCPDLEDLTIQETETDKTGHIGILRS